MIVKVQLPIATNDPNPAALIYDEGREHRSQQQLTGRAGKLMAGDFKAFFEAVWDGAEWQLGKRVGWQSW